MHAAVPKKRTYFGMFRTRVNLGDVRSYLPLLGAGVEFLQLMSTSVQIGCVTQRRAVGGSGTLPFTAQDVGITLSATGWLASRADRRWFVF